MKYVNTKLLVGEDLEAEMDAGLSDFLGCHNQNY